LHVRQATLGDATGFGKRSIARYEAGGALPSIQAAAALARILGVSLDRLGGMDADQDPELARMLAQVAQLSEEDRAFIRCALQLVAEKSKRWSRLRGRRSNTHRTAYGRPCGGLGKGRASGHPAWAQVYSLR
jgi:transcriptional regulator with XRE-family HTH domain